MITITQNINFAPFSGVFSDHITNINRLFLTTEYVIEPGNYREFQELSQYHAKNLLYKVKRQYVQISNIIDTSI